VATTVKTLRERFEERYVPEPNSGCWLWTGGCNESGYGMICEAQGRAGANNRPRRAHRVSYEMHLGAIPDGMMVCHKCDVPSCVNPCHLFCGTGFDNARDMAAKGRQVFQRNPDKAPRGNRHGSKTMPSRVPRGDSHGSKTMPHRVPRGDRHGSRTKPESRRFGDDHWSHRVPHLVVAGERHGMSKITDAQVACLRMLMAVGATGASCGRWFGISKTQACRIYKGEFR
jgi:hypothetical protein